MDSRLEQTLPDNHDSWVESGIDINKRMVMIDAELDETNSNKIVRAILRMDQLNSYQPITVYINSPGGDCYCGFAIYDTLTKCKSIVHTIVIGHAMSMATVIALAGDKRTAYNNARFMTHSVTDKPLEGKVVDLKINFKESEVLLKKIIDIYAEKTNKDAAWWHRFIEYKDRYFGAEEALELGFVDNVL